MGKRNIVNFHDKLKYGKDFEDEIALRKINDGCLIFPKYLYVGEGAPCLFGKNVSIVLPDIEIYETKKSYWIECKRKTKMKKYPATGYSLRLHDNYRKVQKITNKKVFIVFKDETTPDKLQLYGNWLDELEKNIYSKNFYDKTKNPWERLIVFKIPNAFKFF